MTQKNNKQKKNNPSYNKAVLFSIILLFMGIFDKLLYPNNDWSILRYGNYAVMIALFVAIIVQFVKMMREGNKKK